MVERPRLANYAAKGLFIRELVVCSSGVREYMHAFPSVAVDGRPIEGVLEDELQYNCGEKALL